MMLKLNPLIISGKEVLPLVEGGKGISVSNGESSGAWAESNGVGTFSAVNADALDENGNLIPVVYYSKTRAGRHRELVDYSIQGGITQAQIAHEISNGNGRLHMNVLWEMGAVEPILHGILSKVKGLVHGVTCGAGMPFKLAEICTSYNVFYHPIVSSARAFSILWKRAYHKFSQMLGGVVYEDPWLAGGHNGLSNSENPLIREDPFPRVLALRRVMREVGLSHIPIFMAGGVWWLSQWKDWLDNPELGPIAFQFGTRPLLTQESPISMKWKQRLLNLNEGDIFLNRFSPTGFYSSAVKNRFLEELQERSQRQVVYSLTPIADHTVSFYVGPRKRLVYLTEHDAILAKDWVKVGFSEILRTPSSTLVFVTPQKADEILKDQINCMGCLSSCKFSNWAQNETGTTGQKADPRSYCIQKTLQTISHIDHQKHEPSDIEDQLMFAGHQAYRFATDPFYENGFIPTVKQLIARIQTGY